MKDLIVFFVASGFGEGYSGTSGREVFLEASLCSLIFMHFSIDFCLLNFGILELSSASRSAKATNEAGTPGFGFLVSIEAEEGARCKDKESVRDCHHVGVEDVIVSQRVDALVLALLIEAVSKISSPSSVVVVVVADNGDGEYTEGLTPRIEDSDIQSCSTTSVRDLLHKAFDRSRGRRAEP